MAGPLAAFNALEKRQQITIVVAVPLLIIALLGYLSWGLLAKLGPDPKLPAFLQRPGGVWTDINAAVEGIAAQEAIIATGPQVEARLKELSDEIDLAEQRLPLEAEKTEVRQLIEKLARDISPSLGRVEFKAVRIIEGGVVKGQEYQPITYQVEIAGDLNGTIKYIDSIEKNTRFMMVKNLTLHPGALTLDAESARVVAALHQVNMEIVTYVYTAGQKKKGK
jgi:hypothetical protein